MFSIVFRQFRVVETKLRHCVPLKNKSITFYCTQNTPKPLKRKKGKAKESTVSLNQSCLPQIVFVANFCTILIYSGITLWIRDIFERLEVLVEMDAFHSCKLCPMIKLVQMEAMVAMVPITL